MLLLITTATSILFSSLEVNGLSSIASKAPIAAPNGVGDIGSAAKELFGEVIHSIRNANIFQAPVRQEGVKLYVATDGEFCTKRPGNGGIRLLNYDSDNDAINDAVRLAEGMTKKHDMFRTGFSGAKLVVNTDIPLEEIERKSLMEDVAVALEALCGKMYTGCDLNTCDIDMDYLTEATNEKYVLAGRESKVDTNVATAASVIGTVLGLVESHFMDLSDLTFTVQGCGKVGSVVAKELVRLGAKRVQTCDVRQGAAQIDGCIEIEDWTKANCDFLIPCANSLAITEVVAKNFPDGIKFCAGATNSPFSSQISKDIFANDRGVFHVPESVSSAGAVLADSVEFSHLDLYRTVEPALLYGWIRNLSRKKASDIVELASKNAAKMEASSKDVVPPRAGDPVGARFPQWIEDNTLKTQTLIVGGGMAGTATAFSLSERYNTKSVLVEAGSTVSPPEGSSNGDSR